MISAIQFVTLGVVDLDRAVGFYEHAFDYNLLGRSELPTGAWRDAWRMPRDLRATYAVLGCGEEDVGRVRLLCCDAPGEHIWGEYERIQDLGLYAVNFRVREIQAGWRRLQEAGAVEKSEPTFWTVNEDISAWDSQCYDPDGVLLDVFEVQGAVTETLGELTSEATEVQTVAVHTGDMGRSQAFYQGLGFEVLYDKMVESMEGFFHLPPGTKLHNVNLLHPGSSPNGRVELAQYVGFPGERLTERAAPPNHGILSIAFATENLAAASQLVEELGGEPVAGPVATELEPLGSLRLATFLGPDGELIELFERS